MPSADNSCILVQADTVFMLRASTTNTLHSNFPGCLLWFFTVSRMTSFMIPFHNIQWLITFKNVLVVNHLNTPHSERSHDSRIHTKHGGNGTQTLGLLWLVTDLQGGMVIVFGYLRLPTRLLRAMSVVF